MSGLLSEEEAGKTDLGTLEKRLSEKATSKDASVQRTESTAPSKSSSASMARENSPRPASARESVETPREGVTSPSTDGDKPSREEVEHLSEAMCSLVTNNAGETRYIGMSLAFRPFRPSHLMIDRILFRFLHLLKQRH